LVIGFNEKKPLADIRNYFNLAETSWALPMSYMSVGEQEIKPKELLNNPQRLAFIDSASNSIQVGKGDFESIEKAMKQTDSSIEVRKVSSDLPKYSLYSTKFCDQTDLKSLKLKFGDFPMDI